MPKDAQGSGKTGQTGAEPLESSIGKKTATKSFLVHHAKLAWTAFSVVVFVVIFGTISAISNIGSICSSPSVSWLFKPVCSYLDGHIPHTTPPASTGSQANLPSRLTTTTNAPPNNPPATTRTQPPLSAAVTQTTAPADSVGSSFKPILPIPKPKPRTPPRLTKETPIFVESTYSADESTSAAKALYDKLNGNNFTLVNNQSDAAILVKIEDITYSGCSVASSVSSPYDHPLTCEANVHVVGQYADGRILFDKYFSGSEKETADSFSNGGYDDAISVAVSNAYDYIFKNTEH